MNTSIRTPAITASLRMALLGLVVSLAACTTHGPYGSGNGPVIGPAPGSTSSPKAPGTAITPLAPAAPSPSYAPPPGGNSHWDASLGVHVLDDAPNTFYRQRTYYHWDGSAWSWSSARSGPWQATDASGVPAQLGRRFVAQ